MCRLNNRTLDERHEHLERMEKYLEPTCHATIGMERGLPVAEPTTTTKPSVGSTPGTRTALAGR